MLRYHRGAEVISDARRPPRDARESSAREGAPEECAPQLEDRNVLEVLNLFSPSADSSLVGWARKSSSDWLFDY
ncbi:MAG: hypothetical protein RL518_560 [Pseudomonadota bacterium]|jgi:hypothetical protein